MANDSLGVGEWENGQSWEMGNRSGAWRAGATSVSSHAPTGEPLTAERKRRAGELPHTPHTRVVLRGTQIQSFHAKIREKSAGWRWRRVGELANAHTCGR